jgi:hypothetical protein
MDRRSVPFVFQASSTQKKAKPRVSLAQLASFNRNKERQAV